MAVDMFLKLEGVPGESIDKTHAGEIEVQSCSLGGSQGSGMASGTGGGTGKVNLQDVHFSKSLDTASLVLFQKMCNGKHIPSALITFRKAGEKPLEYLKIKLTDIIVTNVSWGGSGGGDSTSEQLSLAFTKIECEYFAQKADGSGEKKGAASWDQKTNS